MGTFHSDEHGDGLVTAGHVLGEDGVEAEEIIDEYGNTDYIGEARDVIDNGNDDNIDCGFIIADEQDPYSAIAGPQNLSTDFGISGTISNEILKKTRGRHKLRSLYTRQRKL